MCNLEQFKFIRLSWKAKSKKTFSMLLEARKYSKRGLLVLYFDVAQDAWVLKDQFNSASASVKETASNVANSVTDGFDKLKGQITSKAEDAQEKAEPKSKWC